MACFSWVWIENFLIGAVILLVVIGVVWLIVPALMTALKVTPPPGGGTIMTALGYILWGAVAIFIIIVAFQLFACIFGLGGTGLGVPLRGIR